MDRAVLDAYGWSDIPTTCELLLDDEIDEEDMRQELAAHPGSLPKCRELCITPDVSVRSSRGSP